jgi:hypothetical protein
MPAEARPAHRPFARRAAGPREDGRQVRGLLPGDAHGAGPEHPPPPAELRSRRRAERSGPAQLDKLRPRGARLLQLLEKADDGETALGSDVMSAALEGYAMLKVSGKGAGLDALKHGMSARFTRKAKIKAVSAAA